ncbi:S9 family peptidase [Aquabacterium sp. OR-4]|uniref:S9 family peptidase n=1 Tax=Aquabacterium sp. OR-4 TaxID=2978127 RepID=UPI0021B2673C|nr:alpha/beta fold hydrolase [Aquabacterium sp. OR-4]MDT7837811.1 prolyl oligopeptidase family serine peptidase [Aquabacterium sp. OR-4]
MAGMLGRPRTGGIGWRDWAAGLAALWVGMAAQGQTAAVAPAAGTAAATATTAAATTAAHAAAGPASALPPAALFFSHDDLGEVELSPSGRQLAAIANVRGRRALAVLPVDGAGTPRVVAAYADADIESFEWVGNERLTYRLVDLSRGSGDQRGAPGLFTVQADGQGQRMVVRMRWDTVVDRVGPGRQPLEWHHRLLAVPRDTQDEVVIGRMVFDGGGDLREVVPMRLNLATVTTRSLAAGMPDGATDWWFDPRGEPRLAQVVRDGELRLHWRGPGDAAWREIARMPNTRRPWSPHSVDEQGGLYVTQPAGREGTSELRRFDFATGQPAGESLVRTQGFDFRGSLVSAPEGGPVLGVRAETDAETTVWFQPDLKTWQAEADKMLAGRVNRLSCRRCTGDDPVLLVASWSDQQPGELWLLRPRRSDARWSRLGVVRKDIEPRRMATLDFHRVPTRDGQQMPLWLTLPAGADKDKRPRPAVLLVHGGPWVRGGHWRWDGQAQFLASRGYVVIEPEFRGSTGYGARWFQAGRKQWGRAMQDDLVDAVHWAAAQGHVDAGRVCIAGASYGGYAALMAPLKHPGIFRCAASWVGVTDPRAMMNRWDAWQDFNDEVRRYSWPALVGDPVTDAALLDEATPVLRAAEWQIPLLLAYGAQDRRVPLAQGEAFRNALRRAGKPEPEWIVYADEGHGWLKPENRFDFARRLEAFLARHLN